MNLLQLQKIIIKNKLPDNVRIMSDSGWEVDATDIDGVYYNESKNVLVFTQGFDDEEEKYKKDPKFRYSKTKGWKKLN